MKIHIDGIIFSLQQYGGISVYFRELLNHLSNVSEVETLVSLEHPLLQNISTLPSNITVKMRNARFMERYRQCRINEDSRIFHSSYYRTSNSKSIPTVVTVYDFTYERYKSGLARSAHILQKHYAIKQAQAIICISNSTYEDLLRWVGVRDNQLVSVIHCGVNEIFKPELAPTPQGHRPFILYVGDRRGYKNFHLACKALELLPDIELHCVGGGNIMPSEYTNLAISIRNRIKYFGLLSDRELNLKYNNAICLIYPSQYEGFGIPVVEAMRAGCPVISINCKAVLEVGGNALELAKTGEPNEIAEAITKLADRVYRRKKSELGIIQSQKFDWEMCHKSTFEVYERLTSF